MKTFRSYTLYDEQEQFVINAYNFMRNASQGDRHLFASPTGTGKSIMELALQSLLEDCWILTPRIEIIEGMMGKLGFDVANMSSQSIIDVALSHKITTPIRFRNMLLKGQISDFQYLIIDESHHHAAITYQQIDVLMGKVPSVGLTATPYRGTPKSTLDLRNQWGEPTWIVTYPTAMAKGYISMPDCKTIGLVDDDNIEIKNGEFVIENVNAAYKSRLHAIVEMAKVWHPKMQKWDKATMFTLPGLELAKQFQSIMREAFLPCELVYDETPQKERRQIFKDVENCFTALIHINVVSEGVDLKLRRGVDLSPMFSPVKWLQNFGRLTRPSADCQPEYICTNRNFLRHAYLLEGCLPIDKIAQAQEEFPPGTRMGVRVMGLEAIGRFKPEEMPLASGVIGHVYKVKIVEGTKTVNYAALIHPAMQLPIWARSENTRKEFNAATNRYEIEYGKWERCEAPNDLSGFSSTPPLKLSDKQKAWWKRCAKLHGLDPTTEPNTKNFAALPILSDLKLRLV